MHLARASAERLFRTVEALGEFDIKRIVAGHCTGCRAIYSLPAAFGDTLSQLSVGTVIGQQ